jgi:hypothetical protein
MISNMTIAAGPQELQSTQQASTVFFGPASVSQTSQTFKVTTAPFFLSAYALQNGDTITVQQVIGSGSGTETAAFAPVIGPVTLTPSVTCVRIDYPGRYQLVHSGPSALGTFTVVGAAQVMASDSLAGLAQALAAVVSNVGTNVTGTAPVVVTPTGLNYNVSLDWVYQDLGSVTGSVNVDWRQSRAFVATLTGTTLTDFQITNLPAQAGLLFLKVIQGDAGGNSVQFASLWTSGLFNNSGTIQPGQTLGSSTLYVFFYDGTKTILLQFASTDGSVGAFNGTSIDVVCGDNVVRSFDSLHRNAVLATLAFGTNTYTGSFNPPLTQYVHNQIYTVTFQNANTGASTFNADTLGAKAIERRGTAVTAGQIPVGATLSLLYDGVSLQIIGAA